MQLKKQVEFISFSKRFFIGPLELVEVAYAWFLSTVQLRFKHLTVSIKHLLKNNYKSSVLTGVPQKSKVFASSG